MNDQPLQLPGRVHVAPTADELFDDLGMFFTAIAVQAVAKRGVFHVALSGGSTPEPFFKRLIIDPRFRDIPWQRSHLWQVDERRVPPDDPLSNFKMIRETLVDHVTISPRRVHPMPVLAGDPATEYENELRRVFEAEAAESKIKTPLSVPRLDLILLGMGDDGHTASLFPGSPALNESRRWVAVNDGPNVTPPPRVTMTFPMLNAGRSVVVLLVGAKKLPTLRRIEAQVRDKVLSLQELPITGIRPGDGELTWFMDAPAADASPV